MIIEILVEQCISFQGTARQSSETLNKFVLYRMLRL